MYRFLLKSKIHRARITGSELHYEGSLSLDETLMEAANLLPFEKIEVYNVSNGNRFSTYVIPAPSGSGEVRLNGAAARMGMPTDIIIIASYTLVKDEDINTFKPYLVYVDEKNRIIDVKRHILAQYDWQSF